MNALRFTCAWGSLAVVLFLVSGCPSSGGQVRDDSGRERTSRSEARERSAQLDFERAVALWQSDLPRDYRDIEELLESALDRDPTLAPVWFNLGVVREAMGDDEDAIEAYRQSNAVDPSYVNGLANVGAMMLDEGREAEAEQILLQVVEIEQFHPGANLNLANIHRHRAIQGEFINRDEADQAINHIRMGLAGDAMNVHAYETLAAVYFDLEQYSLAKLVCVNAITLGLESADLHNRLGLIALAEDDVTTAYAHFRQAIAMDDQNVEALMNLGAIALNYRDYESAFEAFQRALELKPEDVDILLSRAVALRGMEDLTGAEQGYRAVLEIDSRNLDALFNLGILYQEYLQDYEGALEWYQTYLRADPGRRSALAQDVQTRIAVTNELIEVMRMYGDQTGGGGTEEPLEPEPDQTLQPGTEEPEEPQEPEEPASLGESDLVS